VDPTTLLGILAALGALLVTMLMEGTSPLAVVLLPALILVFGGTFGAAIAGSTAADVRKIGSWFRLAFTADRGPHTQELIAQLVDLATKARKEGMLPLENHAQKVRDPFLRRGLQMAIDGVPLEQLRTVLEREIAVQRGEDRVAARFFTRMGGYAPTIGIIGTVVGLVQVLKTLDDPTALGPLVAGAFVATLWGVLSANFVWLPLAAKIDRASELRARQMQLLVEGVAEITAGSSPRLLRQRLQSMVPPSEAQHAAA
jgi:chemotaxis protein MotA